MNTRFEVQVRARQSHELSDTKLMFDGILEEGQAFIVENKKGTLIGFRDNSYKFVPRKAKKKTKC